MYKLYFSLDRNNREQANAIEEILGYTGHCGAEYVRHAMLIAALRHPEASFTDILTLAGLSADTDKRAQEDLDSERYYRVCLRWPKNQKTESPLDELCFKASTVNFSVRKTYLLGLFMLGRNAMRSGEMSVHASGMHQSEKVHKSTTAVKPKAPVVHDAPSTAKPDVKSALKNLMKRDN